MKTKKSKILSSDEMRVCLKKINRRIKDLKEFDVASIDERSDPRIAKLESRLESLMVDLFEAGTAEFSRYSGVRQLDTASLNMLSPTPIAEVREGLVKGIERAISLLEGINEDFEERLEDLGEEPKEDNPHDLLQILHSEILSQCVKLYLNDHYSEAVEKGFRVVRERLRKLTGHEKGTDAFGKGKLFINGAAAGNVEHDFNEAVKFLTMAVDQFRNEKVHTVDGNIEDPVRAIHYLTLSSLAMYLLDNAEVKPS